MSNYEIAFNSIINKIKTARRKENSYLLFIGILKNLGITVSVFLIAVFLEMALHGDTVLRTILFGFVFVSFFVSFVYFVGPELLRIFNIRHNPSIDNIALRIGNHYPELKDNICNAIQMIPISNNPKGMSSNLALAAFESIYQMAHSLNFDVIVQKDDFKKILLFFLIPLAILGLSSAIIQTSFNEAMFRLANYNKSFLPPVPFSLKVVPDNLTLSRGEKLKIEVLITGTQPQIVKLNLKEENQKEFDSFELKANNEGKYIYEIGSVRNSLSYFAHSEWFGEKIESNQGIVKVIEKPIIKSISGRVIFPGYTNLSPKFFDEKNADITAIRGTKLTYNLLINKDIKSARITFIKKSLEDTSSTGKYDTLYYNLNVSGNKANGEIRVDHTGLYYFDVTDIDGYKNENPINYTIIAQNDNFPEISLIEPSSDVEINANGLLPVKVKISDDYGFSSLKLYYRLAESPYTSPDEKYKEIDIKFLKNELSSEVAYVWDLNKLGIMPEDRFEFYLQINDNDIISGPKSSKTQFISVRLPSLREVQKEADLTQEKVEKNLEKLMKEALEVKKDIDELNRELLKNKNGKKEADFKDKKKAEEIAKKQQDLREKMSDIQEKLEETSKKLQENNLISQETLEKYMELQKLMKQVDSPELRMMQEKMQKALQNMDQEQLKKAMENFKFNEEQFRQSIERAMNLLKRMQAEQKTDALKKRAEELAKQQDELSEETKNADPKDNEKKNELAKRQEKLQNELKNLEQELSNLENLMKEIGEEQMPLDDLKDAQDALNKEETSSEMQSSKESMQKGEMNKSNKSQKKASQNLKKFAQKMGEMKEKMKKQSIEETMKQMQKSISDMLELSDQQENIKNKTSNMDYNSTSLPQMAQNQAQNFEALANVAKGMMELSQKSFAVTPEMGQEMAQALNQMRNAVESMADRDTRGATQAQSQAMGAMNRTIGQMQQMMEELKQQNEGSCNNPGGSGSGEGQGNPMNQGNSGMSFSQRMQQIASEQQAVNQALQQMMQNGSGDGKTQMERQAQQARMADKQGSAQKSVEELIKEQKQYAGDKGKLGELEKIADEMKEIMSDIESRGATPETLKRQERILSRLLDLNRSENERDFEKKREGKTANDIFNQSPAALDLKNLEGNDKLFRDLLKNNQQGYTKDYENLIRAYFELIKEQ